MSLTMGASGGLPLVSQNVYMLQLQRTAPLAMEIRGATGARGLYP